ncbi:MAG: LacI family DNA-binding transcriptional regulator [Eubacteriales bacterium]|nr:LacI family DNA-binding transcriptional regulator [Eubacteriales bacterium]
MAATIKDIARMTGLGLATISSYLNGGNVREKNRIKIEKAIEELHFEVNEVARGLKTNRTHTVGVVIPELNNEFCSEVITSMEDVLRSHGYAAMVCDCRTNPELERQAVEFLSRKRVDALVNMPVDSSGEHLRQFAAQGRPIVLMDRAVSSEICCDRVLVDNVSATKHAVEYLLKRGHRRIGVLAGPKEIFTVDERLRGYLEALGEAGIRPDEKLIYCGDFTLESGICGMKKLRAENPEMTAVLAINYETTIGAMIGLNEQHLRVPEQMSLIGFDNRHFARACSPGLTFVAQPTRKIGEEVARLVLERLKEPKKQKNEENGQEVQQAEPVEIRLKTELVEGSSVGVCGEKR